MKVLNLGILAHVDAGKTSLTERLLYHVGVLNELGSVDSGTTHTDSLELEQKRGITIQSSVVSFNINQTKINLIDTPGHADFISEVDRALSVIDAVVLVISAVEGIQAQTRILINTLKRLKKPTLLFINKIDRPGANTVSLVQKITEQLQLVALPMVRVENMGTVSASVSHLSIKDSVYYSELMDALISNDDAFLAQCIDNDLAITKSDFLQQILTETSKTDFYPLYFGSAATGVGIAELCVGIEHYLPCRHANPNAELEGTFFKIEHNNHQSRTAYVNLTAGELELRKTINLYRRTEEGEHIFSEKISSIKTFQQGTVNTVNSAPAGNIACLTGLKNVKIGDTLSMQHAASSAIFARPTLETTINPINPEHRSQLFSKLKEYAEQDPFIRLEQKDSNNAICIKLYGEVQQQILKELLASESGIEVNFSNTKMICIERPVHTGKAVNIMDLHNLPIEFYATLGFKIEPGAVNSGIQYNMQAHSGRIPKGYHSVIEEAIFKFLKTGLFGWQVTDCIITLTDTGVCPLSLASHFRQLTPILLKQALEQAETAVCEPFSVFEIETPMHLSQKVLTGLAKFNANVTSCNIRRETYSIKGDVFTKHLHDIDSMLPGLTQGRGVLISHHAGFRCLDRKI